MLSGQLGHSWLSAEEKNKKVRVLYMQVNFQTT
jgi:hypothetical protein